MLEQNPQRGSISGAGADLLEAAAAWNTIWRRIFRCVRPTDRWDQSVLVLVGQVAAGVFEVDELLREKPLFLSRSDHGQFHVSGMQNLEP